ncbi:hypothetical protein ACETU7_04545 [Rhodococcus sp. 3Y1]
MTLSLLVIREDVILTIIIATLLYALAWITAEFLSARRAYDEWPPDSKWPNTNGIGGPRMRWPRKEPESPANSTMSSPTRSA